MKKIRLYSIRKKSICLQYGFKVTMFLKHFEVPHLSYFSGRCFIRGREVKLATRQRHMTQYCHSPLAAQLYSSVPSDVNAHWTELQKQKRVALCDNNNHHHRRHISGLKSKRYSCALVSTHLDSLQSLHRHTGEQKPIEEKKKKEKNTMLLFFLIVFSRSTESHRHVSIMYNTCCVEDVFTLV